MNSHSHNIEAFQLGRSLLHDATGHSKGGLFSVVMTYKIMTSLFMVLLSVEVTAFVAKSRTLLVSFH